MPRLRTLALVALLVFPAFAEEPFITEEAETLAPGLITLDVGFGFRNEPRDFGIPERDRQLNLAAARVSFGVGNVVELQISGVPVQVVELGGETNSGSGDWVFGTKVWFLPEARRRPSLAFLYEVKLPNASNESGGATDETDVFGHLLISKGFGDRFVWHTGVGMGILGNPFVNAAQNDVFILRSAAELRVNPRTIVGLELDVQGGPQNTDDPSNGRLVFSRNVRGWAVYGGIGAGLTDDADQFRLDVGFRTRFRGKPYGELPRRNTW